MCLFDLVSLVSNVAHGPLVSTVYDFFPLLYILQLIPNIKKVALRLLTTLGFLKQQNVIHADLKPENILLKSGIYILHHMKCMCRIYSETYLIRRYWERNFVSEKTGCCIKQCKNIR